MVRVRAAPEALADQGSYEVLSCLEEGTGRSPDSVAVERDGNGRPIWKWRRSTVLHPRGTHAKWEREGAVPRKSDPRILIDIATGKEIGAHRGSIAWNHFRQRWIMIFGQTRALGDIWYSEAPTPFGPWGYAVKIVTHTKLQLLQSQTSPVLRSRGRPVCVLRGNLHEHLFGESRQDAPLRLQSDHVPARSYESGSLPTGARIQVRGRPDIHSASRKTGRIFRLSPAPVAG